MDWGFWEGDGCFVESLPINLCLLPTNFAFWAVLGWNLTLTSGKFGNLLMLWERGAGYLMLEADERGSTRVHGKNIPKSGCHFHLCSSPPNMNIKSYSISSKIVEILNTLNFQVSGSFVVTKLKYNTRH